MLLQPCPTTSIYSDRLHFLFSHSKRKLKLIAIIFFLSYLFRCCSVTSDGHLQGPVQPLLVSALSVDCGCNFQKQFQLCSAFYAEIPTVSWLVAREGS